MTPLSPLDTYKPQPFEAPYKTGRKLPQPIPAIKLSMLEITIRS
jgi:hypothetical protein